MFLKKVVFIITIRRDKNANGSFIELGTEYSVRRDNSSDDTIAKYLILAPSGGRGVYI